MKKSISFLLIIFSGLLFGQNKTVLDSLTQAYNSTGNDSVKVVLLDGMFYEYLNRDIKKAKECAMAEIEMARKLNLKTLISGGYMNLGSVYRLQGDYKEALKYYFECLDMHQKLKLNTSELYINIAIVYGEMKEFKKAMEYDIKSLKFKREKLDTTTAENKKSLIIIYNNLGIDYFNIQDYQTSLKYYFACVKMALLQNDREALAVTHGNIGTNYLKLKLYDKALDAQKQSLKIAEEINSFSDIAEAGLNIGILHNVIENYSIALPYFEKAIAFNDSTGDKIQRLTIYKNIIKSYDGIKDFKNKSIYLSKLISLNDSIFTAEKVTQLNTLRAKFETEEKEKENTILSDKNKIQFLQLKNKNYVMLSLGLLFLITVIVSMLLFRQNKLRSEQKAIQLEQKLLRSQMNPHFIFNSLATIESFIYENEPKEAGRYLSDFARLMRLILENSTVEYISLSKEIKTLEYYLTLQKLRLDDNLKFTIYVDENLDSELVMVPPMLTQPFIENAIEHGFRGSTQTGNILVSFKQLNEQLLVEVEDNGIGINKAMQTEEKNKKHKSMAMQITKERLSVLNRSKKQKLTFSISDISDSDKQTTGTKVVFSIPL